MKPHQLKVEKLITRIAKFDSTPSDLFNPYTDTCPFEDREDAPSIRCENLLHYFSAQIKKQPRSLWVFEAPGYRGCRRTGLPLISENLLDVAAKALDQNITFRKATKTPQVSEISANIVWEMISKLPGIPLIWNAYPLHPFKSGNPLSNRTPRKKEISAAKHILKEIIEVFRPEAILAVGRVAEKLLKEQGILCIYIRHPAHGGIGKFRSGISEVYR